MLTQHRHPAPGSTTTTRPTRQFRRTGILTLLALSLAACSGGGGSSTPPTVGSVIVQVTNSAGVPISGAGVALSAGGANPSDPNSDPNGEVTFQNAIAGPRVVSASKPGYFLATRDFNLAAGSVTKVTLILDSVTKATPVVLATHPTASSDGKSLTVDVDMAVLDENGTPWQTLTASDFEAYGAGGEGDYGTWVVDALGHSVTGYTAQVDRRTISFVAARSRPATATAVLLEQSAEMANFDPTGQRLKAVNRFFESITPPDTVTLGTYQGIANSPVLKTYGGFTSDGASLATTVSGLAGQEQGGNPLETAVAEMIQFAGSNAAAGPIEAQRAVVVLTSSFPGYPTNHNRQAFLEAVDTGQIPVVIIGRDWSDAEAWITARTGGAFVLAQYPEQLPVVFRSLGEIVGRSLAFNRVRIVLDAGKAGVFVAGSTVTVLMSVDVGPQTELKWIPVAVRI